MIEFSLPLIAAIIAILVLIFGTVFVLKRKTPKLDQAYYLAKWQELQALCDSKNTWPLAIINADKLLDDVLKKRRYKGKTMGERLVAAQHDLSSNDGVWFGHKMRNKLVHEDYDINKKSDLKDAMLGFLQALRDLGAIKK
jgi:hypothetical protein